MKPKVSIICLAYNHEKYIREALDSIVTQKTAFPFEIIISDDASNDSTAQIINEYEEAYPELIKPEYFTTNQYSQGIDIISQLIKKAKGKYIAFCECDDYFTDNEKLQKQYDFLEANLECVAYVHDAVKISENGKRKLGIRKPFIKHDYLKIEDILQCIASNYALNTLMVRSECLKELPDYYYMSPVGDIPLAIKISLCGTIYYDKKIMSAYRLASQGSWSQRIGSSKKYSNEYCNKMILMLEAFNKETNYKYKDILSEKIELYEFWRAQFANPRLVFKEKRFHNHFKRLSVNTKVKLIVKALLK
ncbi:glycosyltransferase [Neobacillus rhizosphaerae]|uniref:glycosyltransferase n=1 Tax=Neobacillus rhizosphaerae TaxID=2880965 RepID=UPI003D2B6D8D